MFLVGGCSTKSTLLKDVNYEAFHLKNALFLSPVVSTPTSNELFGEIVDYAEGKIKGSPLLKKFITRKAYLEKVSQNPEARETYTRYSEMLSSVGISDPTMAAKIAKNAGVALLISIQVVSLPCPKCEQGSQLALVGHIVEGKKGEIQWRSHKLHPVVKGKTDPKKLRKLAFELVDETLEILKESLTPKWHRLRFKHLTKR